MRTVCVVVMSSCVMHIHMYCVLKSVFNIRTPVEWLLHVVISSYDSAPLPLISVDVAISAPFADNGVVYIYHSSASQVITPTPQQVRDGFQFQNEQYVKVLSFAVYNAYESSCILNVGQLTHFDFLWPIDNQSRPS